METMELFSTYTEYEKWIMANKKMVQEYVCKHDVEFENLLLSSRAYNILRINGLNCISDVVFLTTEEITNLEMMNKSTVDSILMFKKNYLKEHKKDIITFVKSGEASEIIRKTRTVESEVRTASVDHSNSVEAETSNPLSNHVKSLLLSKTTKEKIVEYLKLTGVELDDIVISNRSYNALRREGVRYLYETISYYPDGFASLRNIGAKSIDEVCGIIQNYVLEHYEQIIAYIHGEGMDLEGFVKTNIEEETDPFNLTIPQLLMHPIYEEKARKYLIENNVPVEQMGLSVRSVNAFMRSNILSFYDALSVYPDNLSSLRNIGVKSIDEIKARMEYYISKMQNAVSAYCSGDESVMYSDEFVFDTVMSCFEDIGFRGISFKQIREAFPEELDETRIKQCIGGLLADKKLEYVDFRLYRVYPSVYSVIEQSTLDGEEKEILLKKLSGMTLETIGQEYGVSRERIRQKIEKQFKKIRVQLQSDYGVSAFDEDYYAYLYSNYEVVKEMWIDFLGVSNSTFGYLVNSYIKGQTQISEALSDSKIDLILRFKIQDYLNRNKILIDGKLIEKQRSDIENYALFKVAHDELSFDEFAEQYNELLRQNGINFDDRLYYTDEVRRTRSNRLSDSMFCLWKQGEKLRYYDIEGHDYKELLDTLSLESFVNVEISTLKLFNEYPEVMAKYDIRDQYELHNLLKKIVDCSKYNEMSILRQPMLRFGSFDRNQAIYDLIVAFSPITSEELAEYVLSEYGYDKGTAQATYFQPLSKYYHRGVYSVEFKKIPNERTERLMKELTEEFYYIADIRKIYTELFEDADAEEINHRSLKALGFTIFEKYVLKNYKTAESFFGDILMAEDVFALGPLNKKYGKVQMYYQKLNELKQSYDILQFGNGQYINFRKLEKLGFAKKDLLEYCDLVYDMVGEGEYFTIQSLQAHEINTKLESLGFDDYFYAGILAMDPRFMWQHVFGVTVLSLKNGWNEKNISKKSFFIYALSKYDSVDLDDFVSDCLDQYGINIADRYEVIYAIAETDMYYDSIMDKVYRNKSYYYAEFDD